MPQAHRLPPPECSVPAASSSDLAELRDRFVQVESMAQPVDIVDGMLINAANSAADMEARPLSRLPI
jgi:hypothetical protein